MKQVGQLCSIIDLKFGELLLERELEDLTCVGREHRGSSSGLTNAQFRGCHGC